MFFVQNIQMGDIYPKLERSRSVDEEEKLDLPEDPESIPVRVSSSPHPPLADVRLAYT